MEFAKKYRNSTFLHWTLDHESDTNHQPLAGPAKFSYSAYTVYAIYHSKGRLTSPLPGHRKHI